MTEGMLPKGSTMMGFANATLDENKTIKMTKNFFIFKLFFILSASYHLSRT